MTKVNWKVEMPKGYDARPRARSLPYTLDEFAIQREPGRVRGRRLGDGRAAPARAASRSMCRCAPSATVQFWSVGRIMETEDGTWRKAQGVDNWAIYKGDGGSLAKTALARRARGLAVARQEGRAKTEDYSDVWNLSQVIDAPASAAQKQWMYENVNIPELVNYMAINSVIRHQDSGWYNWFIARDTEGTGRWELWHWDLNWIFTTPASDGKGTFLTPDTSNRLTQARARVPG